MFQEQFEKLLENLSSAEIDSYVMTDSNINLLRFDNHPPAVSLIESAMENGFIQTVMKASRIFDGKISLIDHIFTNTKNTEITSGSIVCDISDHFITFISPPLSKQQIKKKPIVTRDMSLQ